MLKPFRPPHMCPVRASPRRQWPQLAVGGKLGPARTAPNTTLGAADAAQKPNARAARSLRIMIATVGRGPTFELRRARAQELAAGASVGTCHGKPAPFLLFAASGEGGGGAGRLQ